MEHKTSQEKASFYRQFQQVIQVLGLLMIFSPTVCLAEEPSPEPNPSSPQPSSEKKLITNSIGMKLVKIPAGDFLMGSSKSTAEIARLFDSNAEYFEDEHPKHRVRISKPFYMTTTEVTQGQWRTVMGTEPWKGKRLVKDGDNYSATYVSWEDAMKFCRKLSQKEGKKYRLPTEAEWEYACRAGSTTMFSFGEDANHLGDYAWYNKNAFNIDKRYVHRVGLKKANAFGLYDMHGNVWEWCSDWYSEDYYGKSPTADPGGPSYGFSRVLRGGSWYRGAEESRSASRRSFNPEMGASSYGFRIVCELY